MKKFLSLTAFITSSFGSAQNAAINKTDTREINSNNEETNSITISVTHIRDHHGVIRFKFYYDSAPFSTIRISKNSS